MVLARPRSSAVAVRCFEADRRADSHSVSRANKSSPMLWRVSPARSRRTLRTKAGAATAAYVAFDLLQLAGNDIRHERLEDRRAELQRIVKGVDVILFSESIAAEGALVFKKACEMGLEGIVSKRVGSIYWSGRARNWTKTRNPAFQRR